MVSDVTDREIIANNNIGLRGDYNKQVYIMKRYRISVVRILYQSVSIWFLV